jgi:hypothetical protein
MTIAQAVGLVITGNAALDKANPTAGWPDAQIFTFCNQVRFVTVSGTPAAPDVATYAPDPNAWLARLHAEAVQGLRLHHLRGDTTGISDRMTVPFVGGGGRWRIEAVKGDRSDLWEARWAVTRRDDPDRRIWTVTYGRAAEAVAPLPPMRYDLRALRAGLERTLDAIAAFARAQHLGTFAAAFARSLDALSAEAAPTGHAFGGLPLSRLPLPARQLLGAVEAGWVFGGMGSWNDLGFEGSAQATYNRLSEALFEQFNAALVVAANSSAPTLPGSAST